MKNLFNLLVMKHTIVLLFFSLIIACNENPKKEDVSKSDAEQITSKKVESNSMISGDYSTLLTNYNCDMSISEIAQVLKVPESDLSITSNVRENECTFNLNGYGKNTLDGVSRITCSSAPSSKKQNKKEIASYLDRKEAGLKIMGMDIQLAETGDCYIAHQPAHGRIIIYNENYDQAFLIHYGIRSANTDRTKEQHEELRLKMTDLANYLLQKHRK